MNFDTSFIFHYLCFLIIVISTQADDCIKQSSCSCSTSTYTIDLSPLSTGANPRFEIPHGGYIYRFQPCIGITGGCAEQTQPTAVCQKANTGGAEYNAGFQSTATFSGNLASNNLRVVYTGPTGDPQRTSTINLVCDAALDGDFVYNSEDPPSSGKFVFTLKTKYACPKSGPQPADESHNLSTGSVLLILFFVFLIVYFVGGVLFLKFARGAQGTEMIPNFEFWTALPGLIKDGISFTLRGCKTDSSYSQI